MSVLCLRMGIVLALGMAAAGDGCADDKAAASPAAKPSVARRPAASPASEAGPARRLCDALFTLPAERKKACCGLTPANLSEICTKQLDTALRRGAVKLDPAAVDTCAADFARELEGCSWVTPLMPGIPGACQGLITGTLARGTACRSSLECQDGLYCRGVSPTRPGVCGPPAPPGAACETPADNLAAFTASRDDTRHPSCEGRCIKGRCLALASAGADCSSSRLCALGLTCIGGRCEARSLPKVGESCATEKRCDGAYCDNGKCRTLKDGGASCHLPSECRSLNCVKPPGAGGDTPGTCADPCGMVAGNR